MAHNPVMRAKRETLRRMPAQESLRLAMLAERCHVRGCNDTVVTGTPHTLAGTRRACREHARIACEPTISPYSQAPDPMARRSVFGNPTIANPGKSSGINKF